MATIHQLPWPTKPLRRETATFFTSVAPDLRVIDSGPAKIKAIDRQ